MPAVVRPAEHSDVAAMVRIATAGESPDGDARYFEFVARTGRLLVAVADGVVVAFGGAVPVGDATMVTDLFVDPARRARGLGRLVLTAVLDGIERSMTFSSTHPGALRLYQSFGMVRGPRLLTMRAPARGGGTPLRPTTWAHDRGELVEWFVSIGAVSTEHSVVLTRPSGAAVLRVVGPSPEQAVDDVLAAVPAGGDVALSVLETHPLVAWLVDNGFEVDDHDVWCARPGVDFSMDVSCVHPGLC
jgi:GNAT superfamily N-acetyltransferase